jgi:hypothetical protein
VPADNCVVTNMLTPQIVFTSPITRVRLDQIPLLVVLRSPNRAPRRRMEDGQVGLGQAAADALSSAMLSSMWSIAVRPPRVTEPSWVKIPLVPSKPVRCPVVPSPASNSLLDIEHPVRHSVVTLARKASQSCSDSHEVPTCAAIFSTCTTCEVAGMVNSGLLAPSAVTAALPPTASAFSRTSSRRTSGVIMRRRSHAVGHVEHDAQLFCEFGPPVEFTSERKSVHHPVCGPIHGAPIYFSSNTTSSMGTVIFTLLPSTSTIESSPVIE